MPEIVIAIWVYFAACGFVFSESYPSGEGARTKPAPNIEGYYVRRSVIVGVIDWKRQQGIACSSIYIIGADKPVHVIGTAKETLKKLRN